MSQNENVSVCEIPAYESWAPDEWDMTYLYVIMSFMWVTSHSVNSGYLAGYNSSIWAMSHNKNVSVCETPAYESWAPDEWDMTHLYGVWLIHVSHTSYSQNPGGMWDMTHPYESCYVMRMSRCVKYPLMSHMDESYPTYPLELTLWDVTHMYECVKYPLMSHGRQMNAIWRTRTWSNLFMIHVSHVS